MTNQLKNDIIDSFVDNIYLSIIMDNDLDDSSCEDYKDVIVNNLNKEEIEEALDNIFEEDVLDNVINGNGEYWREEYNIYNLNDHLTGEEYNKAFNIVIKQLGI